VDINIHEKRTHKKARIYAKRPKQLIVGTKINQ